jgi:diguanylate cyclase (GGDEF)-like protein/PAS domain S-box-containing protein
MRLVGVETPDEVIGKTDFDLFPQEDVEQYYADEQAIFRSGQPLINREEPVVDKAGNRRWVLTSKVPLRDSHGKIVGLVGINRDITERKQAEEALRESEEKYHELYNEAPIGYHEIDTRGTIVRVNQTEASLLGYAREEMLGRPVFDFLDESCREAVRVAVREKIERKRPLEGFECTFVRKNGDRIVFAIEDKLVFDDQGQVVGIRSTLQDITERRKAEETIRHLAYYDALTNLPNRTLFNNRLALELSRAQRNQQKASVMLLDLDKFKDVNDKLGHTLGDQLLQSVSRRLTDTVRLSDSVARMGGDEFILLLPEIAHIKDATKTAEKILKVIQKPFTIDDHKLCITTSIGITIYPTDGEDAETLIKNADIAMYKAKESGRNRYSLYGINSSLPIPF